MIVFAPAPHNDVLMFLIQVAVLLVAARACGQIAQRLGQPAVVGEILAGVILGPSLLSTALPWLGAWVIPQNEVQGHLLEIFSLLGAMLLLLITGLETDIPLIRRHARTALGIAAGGLILPFASGSVLAIFLPDSLLSDPQQRTIFVLFVATTMSISAIPVLAKVLIDLNLMRRDIGQTIMAAGMVDDTAAWILLSLVLGLAGGATLSVVGVFGATAKIFLFMAVSFTLGRWFLARALDFVQDRMTISDRLLTLVVASAFIWGAMAQAIGIEAVLGAFVVGVLFGTMRRLPEHVIERLYSVTMAVFAPVFFAVAGLKLNLPSLFTPELLLITLIVLAVASFGKIAGAYAAGRVLGIGHWRSLAFGAALNARGAVQIIIATIGLSIGILTAEMYSIIVVMAVLTSIMTPLMLRAIIPHLTPDAGEEARLRRETLAQGSLLAQVRRALVPVRVRQQGPGPSHRVEAYLLERLGTDIATTLLSVSPPGDRVRATTFLNEFARGFAQHELTKRVLETESGKAADAIVAEATKDYDLIILGATEQGRGSDVLFSPLVDYIVRMGGCPTIIVKGMERPAVWPPAHILVPSNGSAPSRQAADLAFSLASAGEIVTLLQVVEQAVDSHRYAGSGDIRTRQRANARNSLETLQQHGEARGVNASIRIEEGREPERVILDVAEQLGVDLIILGTDVRTGTDRLFLGPRVERILQGAHCPVVVMNIG